MTPEIEALCARLEAFEGSDALGNGDFRLMSEAAAKLREMAGALEAVMRQADSVASGPNGSGGMKVTINFPKQGPEYHLQAILAEMMESGSE